LKEQLYGFTREAIFDRKRRQDLRELSADPVLRFQVNQLTDQLERDEADVEVLKEQALLHAGPFREPIDILTSMRGIRTYRGIGGTPEPCGRALLLAGTNRRNSYRG
jgi:transposase